MEENNKVEKIIEETSATIEEKTQLHFHNRAERRKFAKKLGKQGRANMGTISDTAKKLTYIDLIQKLRELNEKEKNNEDTTKDN